MKARYIDIDGRKLRIDFNWNATIDFLDLCEIDLDKFIELSTANKITPRHIRQLAWIGAVEGEKLDGRQLEMGEVEFGTMLYPEQIRQIMKIFAEQFTGIVDEKKKTAKPPRVLFRIFR